MLTREQERDNRVYRQYYEIILMNLSQPLISDIECVNTNNIEQKQVAWGHNNKAGDKQCYVSSHTFQLFVSGNSIPSLANLIFMHSILWSFDEFSK